MRARAILVVILVFSAAGAGCGTVRYDHAPGRGLPLDPLKTTATYEIIGPTEGSSGGTSFLGGLFKSGFEDKCGDWGQEFRGSGLGGFWSGAKGMALNAAQYNAIENLPEADALLSPRWTIEETNYFLYSTVKATVKGKGIRYNQAAK
jgi:hypothetical protein